MTNIDVSVKFVSINIALLTISDSRSENEDESGDLLNERITNFGHTVKKRLVIKEDVELIKHTFLDLSNDPIIDVIIVLPILTCPSPAMTMCLSFLIPMMVVDRIILDFINFLPFIIK